MKSKNIAIALWAVFLLAALAGCATAGRETTTTRAGLIPRAAQAVEDTTEFMRKTTDNSDRHIVPPLPDLPKASSELSARHLSALIGLPGRDVHTSLGGGRTLASGPSGRRYSQTFYGKSADFDIQYDAESKVDTVVVSLDKADAPRWRRELNALYGVQGDSTADRNRWLDKTARIDWMEIGDQVRIVFRGKAA